MMSTLKSSLKYKHNIYSVRMQFMTVLLFQVTLSMLEIYNEQVRDLLKKSSKKGGLQVRQHPAKGFYGKF